VATGIVHLPSRLRELRWKMPVPPQSALASVARNSAEGFSKV
jgi:hypothetical protein